MPTPQIEIEQVLKATATLLARIEQRDARMEATVEDALQIIRNEVTRLQQRVDAIVSGAQARITEEAAAALGPVTAQYGRVMVSAATQLHGASRAVWACYAGLAGLGLLMAVLGWGVLGHYQRQLVQVRDELARHENAIPVVRAFHASDAVLCGDRLCVNVDPGARGQGDRQQYLPARPSVDR